MTPQRWARIKEVFFAAVELDEPRRTAFVADACHSDSDLRREVARLLTQHEPDAPADLTGQTVAHYKVIEKIANGGMGVVYKAEDTKLHRAVALKFLRPDGFADEESKRRLLQEARAAAALDHPSICTIYDIETSGGRTFVAMAYIRGETLSEKIKQRPLPVQEALHLAASIADGLYHAHENGVVHRDVKPENVMVTPGGQVKIMDFGLARLASGTRLTQAGTLMGTPAYMSPEQVRGDPVDNRTDIWSLGVVLYQMVTGQLPFRGDSAQALALSVQNRDPEPVTALRAAVHPEIDFILGKALSKQPAARYHHADEMASDLRNLASRSDSGPRRYRRSPSGRLWAVATLSMAALVAVLLLAWSRQEPKSTQSLPLRRFSFSSAVQVRSEWWGRNVTISPDGKLIAMASSGPGGKLWLHDLSRGEGRSVEGTEGAFSPFWSPDSEYVAYLAGNALMKVRTAGGLPIRICDVRKPWFTGGTWSPDGEVIVFASDELFEVPARGGVPKPLRLPDWSIERKYHPLFLPAPRSRVLVFAGGRGKQNLYLYDVPANRLRLLGPGCKPAWSPSGHLVYQPEEFTYELWARGLLLGRQEAAGEPFVIAQRAFEPSVAQDGTLVYREPSRFGKGFFLWADRRGKELERVELEGVSNHYGASLDPEGRRIAFLGRGGSSFGLSVWLYDPGLRRSTRLTSDKGRELVPTWSPAGDEVAFASNRTGTYNIYVRRADGSGDVRPLTTSGNNFVTDWSRDGRHLLYEETVSDRLGDIWYLERGAGKGEWTQKPFLVTPNGERFGRLSPNGRFVAYLSDETGRDEVYVRPFPEGNRKWTVSSGGAYKPIWGGDGRELYYGSPEGVFAVRVTTESQFTMKTPVKLFEHRAQFDVSADGQRFLLAPPEEDALQPVIRVVQSWHAEFNGRR